MGFLHLKNKNLLEYLRAVVSYEAFRFCLDQGWIHSFFFLFLNSNSLTLKKLNSNSLTLQKSNSNSSITRERIQIQSNPHFLRQRFKEDFAICN